MKLDDFGFVFIQIIDILLPVPSRIAPGVWIIDICLNLDLEPTAFGLADIFYIDNNLISRFLG